MSYQISLYIVSSSIERAVFKMAGKLSDLGVKAAIYSNIPERISSLDSILWTLGKDAFIPHDFVGSETAEHCKILLTHNQEEAIESAKTIILIDTDPIDIFLKNKDKLLIFIHKDNPDINSFMEYSSKFPNRKIWYEDGSGKWTTQQNN